MWSRIFFLFISPLICSAQSDEEKVTFEGFQVLRTFPDTHDQLDILHTIEDSVEGWTPISGSTHNVTSVDVLVSPKQIKLVKSFLNCNSIRYTTTILDLQRAIDVENQEERRPSPTPEFKGSCVTEAGISWTQYHGYDTHVKYMECLASKYAGRVIMYNIGTSTEGRPLKLVKIGSSYEVTKKAIWIDCGIHAREWISPATCAYILREFAENSIQYTDILDKFDVYIMPSMNPDGYEYTRSYNRMWRKTRSNNPGYRCKGVDPNRNWGYNWGLKGASTNPCDETYRGPRSFSEPETAAVRDFIMARRYDITMYLTLHSYGQMFLYPWGYDRVDHSQEYELKRLGNIGARAMGRGYTVGSAAKVLYPAAGGSDDWAFGGAKIPYSYTIELPDTGSYGFILPASQIRTVGSETVQAVHAMMRDLKTYRG